MSDLVYEKYGTRIAAPDEANERLRAFAFDGVKAMLEDTDWEVLPGCFERVPAGTWDGDRVFAYLWPIAREVS